LCNSALDKPCGFVIIGILINDFELGGLISLKLYGINISDVVAVIVLSIIIL
jgi:hypothetical protein